MKQPEWLIAQKGPKEEQPMIPGRGRREVGRNDRARREDRTPTGGKDPAVARDGCTKLIETSSKFATLTRVRDRSRDFSNNAPERPNWSTPEGN